MYFQQIYDLYSRFQSKAQFIKLKVDLTDINYLLKKDPDKAFELIYDNLYENLCKRAYKIVLNQDAAQDIVQDIIMELWNKKDVLIINSSLEGYLNRSVQNRSLNYLKLKANGFENDAIILELEDNSESTHDLMELDELKKEIGNAIEELPDKCKEVFALSRFEELSYQEIANHLQISTKTVENQISKALKFLRKKLSVA